MGLTPNSQALAPDNLILPEIMFLEENTIIANYSVPAEQLPINKLLDDLSFCESGHRANIIVWDNGSYSYGEFMFKLPTIKMYSIRYEMLPGDLEDADYINWALDGQYSRKLAKRIIEDGGWRNWYNCLKGYKKI
jgi:hypothetical protein